MSLHLKINKLSFLISVFLTRFNNVLFELIFIYMHTMYKFFEIHNTVQLL